MDHKSIYRSAATCPPSRSRVVSDVFCPKCLAHYPVDPIRLFCSDPACGEGQHLVVVETITYKGDLNG